MAKKPHKNGATVPAPAPVQEVIPPEPVDKGGRPEIVPTDDERSLVSKLSIGGVSQELIAKCIRGGISETTLRKAFRFELDVAKALKIGEVSGRLLDDALKGNTTSQIFFLKCQGGWRETDRLELTGKDGGPVEYVDLTDDERVARITALLERGRAERARQIASSGNAVESVPRPANGSAK